MDYYKNKNILITGAFGGFGLCFTSQLLGFGAKLILSDTHQASQAFLEDRRDSAEPRADPGIIAIIPADLSTHEGCRTLYNRYRDLGIPLDMIIHNAGIGFGGEFLDIPPDLNEQVISVNLMSIMKLNAFFLPELVRRRSGHLIYLSSVAGLVATPLAVSYTTSKFAVRALAMALHGEIKKHGIRTSIVYPFFSKTPILKSPVFGNAKARTLPGFCATTAEHVARATLEGARKGKLHICPGFFSRFMWWAARIYPVIPPQCRIRGFSS